MGHKKKASSYNLHKQAYDRLTGMMSFGDSRREDKISDRANGTDTAAKKIYSFKTYSTYWEHVKYFIKWIGVNHPEVRLLDDAKQYVPEWLRTRVEGDYSPYSIDTDAAALTKLYGMEIDDPDRFRTPTRSKTEITRSRGTKANDKNFSEEKNEELVNFCKACGPRRNVLEKLKGDDLYSRARVEETLAEARSEGDEEMIHVCTDALGTFPDKEWFILHRNDKGGKSRIAPIVGPHLEDAVRRMRETASDKYVWGYVNKNCDVHSYRSDYATFIYKEYARPIEDLKFENKIRCADGQFRSEIYVCRGDEAGKKLDRKAIGIISIALGHNREDTAIANYIRNL